MNRAAIFRRIPPWVLGGVLAAAIAFPQSRTMTQGAHRMELMLERLDGDNWHTIDPGLVLESGDRVRFRFRTSFDGYLYVTNLNTSGGYEQLFPRQETGENNRITANQEYKVPAERGGERTINVIRCGFAARPIPAAIPSK